MFDIDTTEQKTFTDGQRGHERRTAWRPPRPPFVAPMLLAGVLLAGCGPERQPPDAPALEQTGAHQAVRLVVSDPVRIGTGTSPLDGDCGKRSDGYTYPDDTETDPRIAFSRTDPTRIAIAFMRDPVLAISTAASEDGGVTWLEAEPPGLSPCTGTSYSTSYNSYGDQDLAVGADDRLYLVSVQGDFLPEGQPLVPGEEFWMNSAVTVSISTDFGRTWSAPRVVSPLGEYQHTTLVATSPTRPGIAHVAWHVHRNPSQPEGTESHLDDGRVYMASTTDRGASWSEPELVMPARGALDLLHFEDGELLAVAMVGEDPTTAAMVFSRRSDGAWSEPKPLPLQSNTSAFLHPENEMVLAIDMPVTLGPDGALHQVASIYDPANNRGTVVVATSHDRGTSWSAPTTAADVVGPAWNAAIGAASDGALGVFWYDARDDVPGDGGITTRARFAVSLDGTSWTETALSEPFDLARGPRPHVLLYLGNYFEVKPAGPAAFGVAFAVAPPLSTGAADLHYVNVGYGRL